MATTAVPPRSLEDALREETDLAEIGEEFSDGVRALVEESRAEARAAGHQYRLLHRLWQLQEEAREQRWMVEAHWMPPEADRLGPHSLEPDEQTIRDVADEIGPALRIPAGTALRRVEDAVLLAEDLPEVLEALEQGEMGTRQAGVLIELWRELVWDARGLPPQLRAPVEGVHRIVDELLLRAPDSTVAQLRALARRRRAGLLRETEEQRHRLALQDRRVWVEPREDGMAQLCALLDAATAHAIQDRLDALVDRAAPVVPGHAPAARVGASAAQAANSASPTPRTAAAVDGERSDLAAGMPEHRTAPQLRADVLADLLLDGEPADLPEHLRGIRGHVTVTVPALALLRNAGELLAGPGADLPAASHCTELDAHCAELDGYGPIPVGLAERIAARAPSWSRILTHPVTGTVLDRDRSTYAVPADLKHRLRARDGTCRFPGCRRRASRCDLDHTIAWADGGRTSADNLAHLCRHHHLLKHRDGPLGRWRVEHVASERLESPRPEPSRLEPGRPEPSRPEPSRLEPGRPEPERRAVDDPDPELLQPGCRNPAAERSGRAMPLYQHGVLEWTSPAGQVHRTYPHEHRHPAPGLAAQSGPHRLPVRAPYAVPAPVLHPDTAPVPHGVPGSGFRPSHCPGPADEPPPF
ncbi:HNH endonuclease signature motif containing protein [Kocuria rhizosphaericola]|uniref:HNH endonuclease signature motif containing protein n=1 Tax=Kocuria rhizosphaericola TaxID=3376284 RepID=UPI0037B79039